MDRRSFVIGFPDTEQAESLAARLLDSSNVVLEHSSGRPWLVGSIPEEHITHHSEDGVKVAVVGRTAVDTSTLARRITRIRHVDELSTLSKEFSGSYIVFGALGRSLFASGPAVPTRQLFTATVEGTSVIADRADILAMLGDFPLDRAALVLSLARGLAHPFDQQTLWKGVEALAPGAYAVIGSDTGQLRHDTWWTRPAPTLSQEEGGQLLAERLREAVETRVHEQDRIASDLSGGLDSTPVTYFAARAHSDVVGRTFYTEDPGGREDLEWARRALPAMPGITEHLVQSASLTPAFYEGLEDVTVPFDRPTQAVTSAPRVSFMLHDDLERGVKVHLNGLGGDHLLRGVRAWDHTLARSRPLRAWRRARAEGIPLGEPLHRTVQQLVDRRSYRNWLADDCQRAVHDVSGSSIPSLNDWSVPLGLPQWISPSMRKEIFERLQSVAAEAEPLGSTLAEHFDLYTLRQAGYLTRGMMMTGRSYGVDYESPLLDDRVVEAVLSVRYEERDTPTEWKPLMKSAMEGLLPSEYLRRTNKIGAGPQPVRGYSAHFPSLRRLWEHSGLLDSGLFDSNALLEAAEPKATAPPAGYFHALTDTAVFLRNWNTTRDEL